MIVHSIEFVSEPSDSDLSLGDSLLPNVPLPYDASFDAAIAETRAARALRLRAVVDPLKFKPPVPLRPPEPPALLDDPLPDQEPIPARELYGRAESSLTPLIKRRQWILELIEKHRWVAAGLSLAAIAVGAFFIGVQLSSGGAPAPAPWADEPRGVYFYDVDSQSLFTHTIADPPPILTPRQQPADQPHGYRAFVFSCGECTPQKWFIAHLETFDSIAQEAWSRRMRARRRPDMPDAAATPTSDAGRFIIDPADKATLLAAASPQAGEVLARVNTPCPDGSLPHACEPLAEAK